MTIAIVADSAASLPPALAAKWGIRVVPLQVIVDGHAYAEGVEIDSGTVLARLEAGDAVSTSQPGPEAFAAAFAEAIAEGADGIVVVSISGTMSGTVDNARLAAAECDVPVEVVDTRTLAMASGFAAIAAADAAARGATLGEAAEVARATAASSRCVFTVASLDHLRRGGRITPAVAAVGKVLGIRPVLEVAEGELRLIDRVRTTARARAALLTLVDDALSAMTHPGVAVMALGEPAFGDDAARAIEVRHPAVDTLVRTPVSAVLAVHTGPGTLAAVVAELPATVH